MNEEELLDIRDTHIKSLIKATIETGNLQPHITIFAKHLDKTKLEQNAIISVMIPQELGDSDEAKELFMKLLFPKIAKKIRKDFEVFATGWASEAWLRQSKAEDKIPDDYQEIPIKKEVAIMTFETKDKFYYKGFDIIRDGKKVTEDGDLIDQIELVPTEDLEQPWDEITVQGRFTNILRYFEKK